MDKTKYMENLVDRFCIKFRLREDEVIFKNAAFSLNLITYNEKALKRLLENFPIYKHALHQQKVYTYFKNILSTASKDPKAEMKVIMQIVKANYFTNKLLLFSRQLLLKLKKRLKYFSM